MKKLLFLSAFSLLSAGAFAQLSLTAAMKALPQAKPGDTLVVANGSYTNIEITLVGKGEATRPVVVKAQTPGGVRISGQSALRLAGEGVEVNGFYFTDGYAPKGAVIEYRAGNAVANHCRITQCAIDNFNPPDRTMENSWVLLYGRNNRFDHNSLTGKLNNGVTLAVILNEERHLNNQHLIDHNYFGKRPNLGSNGGETIRVGTSQSSLASSRTRIEANYFEHCDGEVEIVSIKSSDNIIRNNSFYECMGVLALRHGNRNLVEGNVFTGNGKPHTGGIRIINEGHQIRNNYFSGLKGSRFFAALAIMNAVPNSLPNRYHQVKNVTLANNTWIDCDHIEFGVGKDNERTLAATNVLLQDNIFINRNKNKVFEAYDDLRGFRFVNNRVATQSGRFQREGFRETNLPLDRQPAQGVQKSLCGATWYREPAPPARALSGKKITVTPGQNTLLRAVAAAGAGDVIELTAEGDYLQDSSIEITRHLRIQGAPGLKTKPVIRYNGTKGKIALLTIADGGVLELQSVAFNNEALEGKTAASAAISPAPVMRGTYSAFVDNCTFYNYGESSFAPFKAQRTTLADTLIFTHCLFRDMSGDAISLAAEKDDAGKYSAEYVEVKNCVFYKVLGYAVDLYRGGSDESTTGPAIVVDHCVLEDVNNKERGAGLRLYGVQNVTVKNTSFSNTGRGGAAIRFDETHWDKIAVTHCNVYNSGRVASFWGGVITGPMYAIQPAYQSVATYNFSLQSGSPLLHKGTNGEAIGLPAKTTSTSKRNTKNYYPQY